VLLTTSKRRREGAYLDPDFRRAFGYDGGYDDIRRYVQSSAKTNASGTAMPLCGYARPDSTIAIINDRVADIVPSQSESASKGLEGSAARAHAFAHKH